MLARVQVSAVDDASGATYYYNNATGETQWEPPEGFQEAGGADWTTAGTDSNWVSYDEGGAEYGGAADDGAAGAAAGDENVGVAVGDWTSGLDEASGYTYYYNNVTGETQWEAPEGFY